MDIRQLRYFLTIAEEGTITKAAKRLHMAQPPLSQQLKFMENELGVRLIERVGRSIRLTEAGESLKRRSEQILELVETTVTELKGLEEGLRGKLSIGTVASSGATILLERIRTFHNRYPDVCFKIWEGDTYRITELLETRVIELGLVRFPVESSRFNILRLTTEPLLAVMSRDWDCGKFEKDVRMADLANKPLMLIRREYGSSIYEMIMEAYRQAGLEPVVLCESNDIMTLLMWAEAGVGMTIVPESAMQLRPNTQLKAKRIIEPSLETTTAVIWLRERYLSTAARRFLELFCSPSDNPL